jgi:hypothetical protein
MSGSGHDVLYETWCRNADLIFQNASTTALAQGCAGHRRPGDGSAGDTPSQPPPAHSGCGGGGNSAALSRAEATKGQENERENTNLLVQRGIQIVIIVSQVCLCAVPVRFCYRHELLGGLGSPRRGRRHFDGFLRMTVLRRAKQPRDGVANDKVGKERIE